MMLLIGESLKHLLNRVYIQYFITPNSKKHQIKYSTDGQTFNAFFKVDNLSEVNKALKIIRFRNRNIFQCRQRYSFLHLTHCSSALLSRFCKSQFLTSLHKTFELKITEIAMIHIERKEFYIKGVFFSPKERNHRRWNSLL